MPYIYELRIDSFRNLMGVKLDTSSQVNILYGKNGAGKTSVLEAIYYLGFGRSFRTNHAAHIINHNTETFSIYARLQQKERSTHIGMQRSRHGEYHVKVNGEKLVSVADLAVQLPIQFLSTMSTRFFTNGPKIRRQFLDWMLFHVEPTFFYHWQCFQRVLKQRNAAIKSGLPAKQITLWDSEFINHACIIDQFRQQTLNQFEPIFTRLLTQLLPSHEIRLCYHRGWKEQECLESLLKSNLQRDLAVGFTHSGPQRADLRLLIAGIPAQDVLSQGQQKVSLYAFHLAQGTLLKIVRGEGPIFLIDDILSELDTQRLAQVANVLQQMDAQIFITGIDGDDLSSMLPPQRVQLFHVEHGHVNLEQMAEHEDNLK